MAPGYSFVLHTTIHVGEAALPGLARSLAGRSVGLVVSRSACRNPFVRECLDLVRSSSAAVTDLGTARPNPRVVEAQNCATVGKAAGVDTIFALGGGSVMDCAKAARVALGKRTSVADLLDRVADDLQTSIRLICMPTLFGTGAEASAGAILTADSGMKAGIRGRAVTPDEVYLLPILADSVSVIGKVLVGFDALAHAAETYLSKAASPLTDVLAERVLDVLPEILTRMARGQELENDTEQLALCSVMMGANLANASTCLPHRMQYALSRERNSNHQADLVALYPAWLDLLAERNVPRLDRVLRALCVSGNERSAGAPGDLFRRFVRLLGIERRLSDHDLSPADATRLASHVSGNTSLDPLSPTGDDITLLFHRALSAP